MKAYEKPEINVQALATNERLMDNGCESKWVAGPWETKPTGTPNPNSKSITCLFTSNDSI